MGILQNAYETYEAHRDWVGKDVEGQKQPLCPVGHSVFKAKLEFHLDREGQLQNVVTLSKKDPTLETIIPVTEKSASRVGNPEAHPLCEQIGFLTHMNHTERDVYLKLLADWMKAHPHWFLQAVFHYIQRDTLLSDLNALGIVQGHSENDFIKGKIDGDEVRKCLIRWVVAGHKCWSGQVANELMDSWSDFYRTVYTPENGEKTGLCMITGESGALTDKADKGIVRAAYGAKLISSNDSTNFTYRGRFKLPEQACTVGYDGSQKAHRGLSWVSANQGVIVGGRTFICWNPAGKRVENPQGSLTLFEADEEMITPTQYRERLKQAMDGFRMDLPDHVVLAAFDAATTGRLSLTFYSEMPGEVFYDRLADWYESCQWPNGKKSPQPFTFREFARLAYGTERSTGLLEVKDASAKSVVQRLTECMVYKARVPSDIVMSLVKNASEPQRYNPGNQYKILRAACMLLRKQLNDQADKEEWTLALDPKKQDRSYQFGRLLAVYEQVEQAANRKKNVPDRPTNAAKYRSMYRVRPMDTVARLEDKLNPYFSQLDPGLRTYFKRLIGEIMDMLSTCGEGELERPLEDTYVMGYYLQRYSNRDKMADDTPADDGPEQDEE